MKASSSEDAANGTWTIWRKVRQRTRYGGGGGSPPTRDFRSVNSPGLLSWCLYFVCPYGCMAYAVAFCVAFTQLHRNGLTRAHEISESAAFETLVGRYTASSL